ncbi:MAG: bifunctional UDP-N-acetylglucosamine diphosphorylase/glucosamine-1-phosphate N-acetyltransferase GlmU [Proteobacteria bacterium]|nr:bifunctional UDP-N-acetylglucosamine diphosphorylase/glucosamine-1-phosphate N-acetyltransferase GlmU [Pseudomonadota bacterium]MBI3499963.1 bifunctional UDP-N-acetylglucosamine diphosphorylase/glucosamine-1-phosphate N-acetyltransferase GlmU [Pseudomonadota bacterium]
MGNRNIAAIVLAAGKGTRMSSDLPKVLHPLAGRPMIGYVVETVTELKPAKIAVVIAADGEAVAKAALPYPTVVQKQPRGTADAVKAARRTLAGFAGDVLIVYGDHPFLTLETLERMLAARRGKYGPGVVVLGFRPEDPTGYGRLVTSAGDELEAIVEHREATPAQRAIPLCNSGVIAVDGRQLFRLIDRIDNRNVKGEFYLTDIVKLARAEGIGCGYVEAAADELFGIDDRVKLARAEALMQGRLRRAAMEAGVSFVDPASVYLAWDTRLDRDVIVHPFVVFGPGVSVGSRVEIRSFSHIEGAAIEAGAIVGPFARLRPGSRVGAGAHVGNFVELKNTVLGEGVKANHLAYLGDTSIGAKSNIGAGTITCNYDGFEKYRTTIGAGSFVGSNATLVAPVTLGEGSYVAAGSTIVSDVAADALIIARPRQVEKPGWAKSFRAKRAGRKLKKG